MKTILEALSAKASETHSDTDVYDGPEPEVCNKSKLLLVGRKDILHVAGSFGSLLNISLCHEVQAYCKISFLMLVGTEISSNLTEKLS